MKLLLILLGAPLWLPLLISVLAVIFSLCIALWSVVVSLWAAFVAFAASAPAGLYGGILNITSGNSAPGCILIACSLVLTGLSIFTFYGALYATKGSAILTKKTITLTKNAIVR